MHRFHLSPEQCRGSSLLLTGREAHHGLRVLRVRQGDAVVVLDGAGSRVSCRVSALTRDTIRLEIHQREVVPPLPYQLTLVQSLPKGKLIDSIIQKATELGVFRIVPLLSARVVPQIDGDSIERKAEHWRTVAIEAIKQCGSAWLPRIDAPATPEAFLARREALDLSLIASLEADSVHPREHFKTFERQHGRRPRSICIWIGPEGDFTPDEMKAAKSAGALPMSLGRLVLRCDTAAVYCLSIVNYELSMP